jgi:hypothetical protein
MFFASGQEGGTTTLNLTNSAPLENQAKGTLTTDNQTTGSITSMDGTGTMDNFGTVSLPGPELDITVPFTSTAGALSPLGNGVIKILSTATVSGGTKDGGGTLLFNGSNVTINDTLNVFGGTLAAWSEAVYIPGTLNVSFNLNLDNASVSGSGSLNMSGVGSVATIGETVTFDEVDVTNGGGGAFNLQPGTSFGLLNAAVLTNFPGATVNLNPQDSRPINVYGDGTETFVNYGTIDLDGSAIASISCNLTNKSGTIDLKEGTLSFATDWSNGPGTVAFDGGALVVNGTFTNNGTVTLSQPGQIQANLVTNSGTVNLGNDNAGQLTITGDYTQTSSGSLILELTGNTTCNVLDIGGNATLGGNLTVTLKQGFTPNGGLWTLMTFAGNPNNTRFGTFTVPQGISAPSFAATAVGVASN